MPILTSHSSYSSLYSEFGAGTDGEVTVTIEVSFRASELTGIGNSTSLLLEATRFAQKEAERRIADLRAAERKIDHLR